jgi:DMSO/TMAO reductase YedYZ molybdopterin-dependent catalytic subunit
MKRSFLLVGALFGFLTSLALMAVSYIGNILINLPFLPFDLFDWVTRHLPGPIVDGAIRSMVAIISFLRLGPTDTTAKLAEQIQALGMVAITGIVFGLVMGWVASTRRRWLANIGWVGGVLLWLGSVVAEINLPQATNNLFLGLVWLLALLLAWGWLLYRIMDAYAADAERSALVVASTSPDPQGAETSSTAVPARAPSITAPGSLTRRNFLTTLIGALASFIVLGLGLQKFRSQTTQTSSTTSSAIGVKPVQAASVPTYDKPFGPQYTSGPAASPSPAVLASRLAVAPGTRPEVIAAKDFYRIDINTLPPVIDGATWKLDIAGLVNKPASLTLDNILNHNSVSQSVTMQCISNPVGGDLTGNNFWTGVPFKDILAEAGLQPTATWISFMAADGFYESMSVKEAMDPRCLLVYAMNGQLLLPEHGFPLRIYIPNHYGMKQPKWLTQINLVSQPAAGYWVERGWDNDAFVLTTSVIDTQTVSKSSIAADGTLPLGGIAWAGARGIQKVEVQIDQDAWTPVKLRTPTLSPLSWVQWRYDWKAVPGSHTVTVRATDGAGALQSDQNVGPGPLGATGLDSASINI